MCSGSANISCCVVDSNDSGVFDQTGILQSGFEEVSAVVFHPFENMLVCADARRNIGVYDYKDFDKLNSFSNDNTRGSRITSLHLINENGPSSLLLAGSDDGVVRIWRNIHMRSSGSGGSGSGGGAAGTSGSFVTPDAAGLANSLSAAGLGGIGGSSGAGESGGSSSGGSGGEGGQELASAWTGLRNLTKGGSGLVTDWQQRNGRLCCTGHTDVIRLWDVERATCSRDIILGTDSYVFSLCSSYDGNALYAGCGDGYVRVFDVRADKPFVASSSKVASSGRVVRAHLQRGGSDNGKLVIGGSSGDIIISDMRSPEQTISQFHSGKESLDAMAAHDYAPLLATGSKSEVIKLFDLSGKLLKTVKYHKGFMGHRIGPVTSLAFHPNQLYLAAGALNPIVSIMASITLPALLSALSLLP